MNIEQQFINYNVGGALSPMGLVIHGTDNPGATAQNHHDYFNGGNRGASAHAFVDWNRIIQLVDWHRASWHAGHTANYSRIGIELCVPGSHDEAKFNEVWNRGVWLAAYLLRNIIGVSAVTSDNVMSHAEVSNTWDETDHQDPVSYFSEYGKTMDDFRNEVQQALSGGTYTGGTSSSNGDGEESEIEKAKKFVGGRCQELQEKLIACGYDCGGYGADNVFGEGTWNSLIAFQKDHCTMVDGLAGKETFSKLDELLSAKSTPSGDDWTRRLQAECNAQGFSNQKVDGWPGTNTLNGCPTCKKGARGNITKLLQERLDSLGYGTNGCDGIFGSGTHNAVCRFQADHGLSQDGIVGTNTWKCLLGL